MIILMNYFKKGEGFMKKHPAYNAIVHALGGMAIGILITYPFVGPHPLRWALILSAIALLGHIYAFIA